MEYINPNRTLGLSGLMRVMNDEATLAASIDSCVNALDELIITYNDCTDNSPAIIEQKKQQYPDKIQVIPYPYHVYGINLTEKEYEYAKSLPLDSPHLLASYYNNALKHANYKYVVKIDADQIYFLDTLVQLRDAIKERVELPKFQRKIGKLVFGVFCMGRANRKLWSITHLRHYLQYILVPLFKKYYFRYVVSELQNGNAYLSMSGVNVLIINNKWCAPCGCQSKSGIWWPYNGEMDTLVFEANEDTYYEPWDMTNYQSTSGMHTYIERFVCPAKQICISGFYWFHMKPMQKGLYDDLISYWQIHQKGFVPLSKLDKLSFGKILSAINDDNTHRKTLFNFVHNMDKKSITKHIHILEELYK